MPDLDAGANAIMIEHIRLENEGWERDTSVAEPQETKHHEEEIVSGMYKEIQNLLRYSA